MRRTLKRCLIGAALCAVVVAGASFAIMTKIKESRETEAALAVRKPDLRGLCHFLDMSNDKVWLAVDYRQHRDPIPPLQYAGDGTPLWRDTCRPLPYSPPPDSGDPLLPEILTGYQLRLSEYDRQSIKPILLSDSRGWDELPADPIPEPFNRFPSKNTLFRLEPTIDGLSWKPTNEYEASIVRDGELPSKLLFDGLDIPLKKGQHIVIDHEKGRAFLVSIQIRTCLPDARRHERLVLSLPMTPEESETMTRRTSQRKKPGGASRTLWM